jgi:hypothetical protein
MRLLFIVGKYWILYCILIGKPERKKTTLGRPRRRWEDNIRMGLREIGWRGVGLMLVSQDRDQWRPF